MLFNKLLLPLQPKKRDFMESLKTCISEDYLAKMISLKHTKTSNLYADEIYTLISKKNPKFSGCELEEYFVEQGLDNIYDVRDLNEIIQRHIDSHLAKGKNMGVNYDDPKNQINMRAKAKEIGAKVQGLYGPYKVTFDCVRLSYPEYKSII